MSDFDEAIRQWGDQAPQLSFLGEIALSKSDTVNYLQILSSRLHLQPEHYHSYAVPITILAVNCAYYTYDDSGFWKHFCRHLNLDCNQTIQDKLGHVIERYFQKIDRTFRKRRGPFRYVGRILEQCGISQYYMEQFINFIKLLKGRSRWATVAELDYGTYSKCVPDDLPKYLKKFLDDTVGWHFVTDVAASLSQRDRNLISYEKLCSLPGYRSEFWADFLKIYDGTLVKKYVRSEADIPPLGLTASPPSLYWLNESPQTPGFVNDPHVYMQPFGKIGIANFHSLETGGYIFVYDSGGGATKIPTELLELEEGRCAFLDLGKLEVHLPCRIELWFETVGRNPNAEGGRQINKWTFIFIDNITISCPQHLFAPEDFMRITLQAPSGYHLHFPPPISEKENSAKQWTITCGFPRVDGELIAGLLSIPVTIPIYRDKLRMDDGSKILLSTDLDTGGTLQVEGVPGKNVQLFIQNVERKETIETGSRIGKEGNIRLNIRNSLGEVLEKWKDSWGMLSQGTGTTEGGLLYLYLPAFMKDIANLGSYPNVFFDALPKSCLKPFKLLVDISDKQDNLRFDVKHIAAFPRQLQPIAWVLAACAMVFDKAQILSLDMQDGQALLHIPAETRKTLLWFLRVQKIHSDGDTAALSALLNCPVEPKAVHAPKWIEMVQREQLRIGQLNSLWTDLSQQIAEWIKEVTGTSRLTYSGTIAGLPYGQQLTQVWRAFYLWKCTYSDPCPSNIYFNAKQCSEALGIVGDLARIIQLAILKETGREAQISTIDTTNISAELHPDLKNLLGTGTDANVSMLSALLSGHKLS